MAKVTIYNILNYVFFTITGYCYLDVLAFIFPFADYDSGILKLAGSVFVSVLASIFWIVRLIAYRESRRKERDRDELRKRILELDIQIRQYKIERSDRVDEANELIKQDKWS